MKPYSSYKDSRIEWISDIPEEWMIVPLKYQFKLVSGFPFDSDLLTIEESDLPVIRIGNVSSGRIDVFYQGDLNNNIPIVDTGDLIISLTGDFIVRIWNNKKSLLNQRCGLIRPIFNVNTKYLFYFLPETLKVMGDTKYFTTLKNLSNKEIESIRVLRPSPPEQQSIVSFLDLKTQQIDDLIEKTQKKIELLKEQRISLINHCVTKGLNPNIEMKDSGIEWIGEIPSHWDVNRIKYMKSSGKYSLVDGPFGSNLKTEHYVDNGDVYIVESGFVTSGKFEYIRDFKTITNEHFETIKRSECNEGDIIISKIGEYYGMCGILPKLDKKTVVSGNSISLTISDNYNTHFVHQVILQHHINGTFKKEVQQTGQPFISLGVISNLSVPIPPLYEQNQIVDYLGDYTQKIDSTIEKETQRIELLKEYRQSLISEVVTGKIDVREWNNDTSKLS